MTRPERIAELARILLSGMNREASGPDLRPTERAAARERGSTSPRTKERSVAGRTRGDSARCLHESGDHGRVPCSTLRSNPRDDRPHHPSGCWDRWGRWNRWNRRTPFRKPCSNRSKLKYGFCLIAETSRSGLGCVRSPWCVCNAGLKSRSSRRRKRRSPGFIVATHVITWDANPGRRRPSARPVTIQTVARTAWKPVTSARSFAIAASIASASGSSGSSISMRRCPSQRDRTPAIAPFSHSHRFDPAS